jgi:phosphate starvation-inducible PhoH-like protein
MEPSFPPGLPPRIDAPSAWHGPEAASSGDWIEPLDDADLDELSRASEPWLAPAADLAQLTRDAFPLPTLAPRLAKLSHDLLEGRGFALWRGLPVERWGRRRCAVAFFGLGTHLGHPLSQNAKGHVLGHVRDMGLASSDPNVRIYQTRERQTFHTDSADFVALLCLQEAREGGLSALVSSATLYNEMRARRPDLAAALFEPLATDRRGEVPPGAKPYFEIPVFNWHAGRLSAIYQRQYIDSAQRFADAPRLSPTQVEALDLLDALTNDPALPLMPTETLHFENARLAQQLFNNESANLRLVEDVLGVKATSREGWIKLEGTPEGIERARQLFQVLEGSVKAGTPIRNREFNQAVSMVKSEGITALKDLYSERIHTSTKKANVTPKTTGQKRYVQAIRQHDVTFGIGPAGTGKTYLAMAMAVSALREEKVSRIILTRPAVEAGEALGFLPGDLYEKIAPYLRPLHDALHDMLPSEEIQKHTERGIIEIAPLAYMRGRTLNHAFIILDEAQNSTTEQMFMFLTRLGHNSKVVITGDVTQIDLPAHKHSGLVEARRALKEIEGIAIVEFQRKDVVRHPLVQRIIQAYEEHRGTSEK